MELTERFGISRPTLREALSALEVLGIVEARGGDGNYIRDQLDIESIRYQSRELEQEIRPEELLESRKLLEADIAEVAARKSEPSDITAIEKNLSQFRSMIEGESEEIDYQRLGQLDRSFHLLIAKATHNAALTQMMRFVIRGLKGHIWINFKEKSLATPIRRKKYLSEHEALLQAVRNRNPKKAREVMHKHIEGVEKDLFG
jgi:GntR family transcriptional repressor for pyruvate dehydrogenase complex